MACIFPGAPDLSTYWHNIQAGVDAIRDVPAGRWEGVFYDPAAADVDRFYCRRGGFVDEYALFDALGFGIMPVAARGAEPDQMIALEVAARALEDAGYDGGTGGAARAFNRERTSVILGRGNYIGAGMTRLEQHVRTSQQLVECLRDLLPQLSDAQLAAVKREFQAKLGGYGPDTAIGLVPNLTASRIANRLDLHGPAYTIDAACASALVATDRACRDLRSGQADVVLTGGVHLSHDVAFWSVFCQLGALSRTQQIRPFDRRADGLLIGEGIGICVLKRLEDAVRDDDRIYAVIRGSGIASDGREASIMTPRVDGQLLAVQRAWEDAALDRNVIGLIEAHGTATPVGDAAELETLGAFFGPANGGKHAGIGSVKSMIGHAMPAAGAAGLIKAALAVHHGVQPPSLHCEEPNPALEKTRFRVVTRAGVWEEEGPRVAGVNAFGFGGINGHLVLAEHAHGGPRRSRRPSKAEALLVLAAEGAETLAEALERGDHGPVANPGAARVGLVDPTPKRRARAAKAVRAGKRRRGRDGLWHTPDGLLAGGGKLCFLYPGVEAVFEPRVADVAEHFGLSAPALIAGDATALESQGVGVIQVARLLTAALSRCGIVPDVMAGHSIGEWSGMIASGMIGESELDTFMGELAPGSLEVPGVLFSAVGAGRERVEPYLDGLPDIVISHDNCPHQLILCGRDASIEAATSRLKEARIMAQILPFRSGFHSRLFEPWLGPHRDHIEGLTLSPAAVPLWSATTCRPYPADLDAVKALAVRHLIDPVRFRELVAAMWDDGVRVFVQLGVGSLAGFVSDTLRGKPHLAIGASVSQRSGMEQLRRVAAALFVEGAEVDFERLLPPAPRPRIRLELGVPLVRLDTPLSLGVRAAPSAQPTGDPVLDEYNALVRDMNALQGDVIDTWRSAGARKPRPAAAAPVVTPTPPPPVPPSLAKPVSIRRRLSVASDPTLLDHCLFPQPPGWTNVSDRYPVVPMTMSVQMMLDAGEQVVPGMRAIALEALRAYRWLEAEPVVEVELRCHQTDECHVRVEIVGYSEATVVLAPDYPEPPAPALSLADERRPDVSADELYEQGWMFHGPAYQCVTEMIGICQQGIRGRLRAGDAEGALLDNAGQLFGYWVMANTERNRLAMPIKVGRLSLFGPPPNPSAELECTVRITHLRARDVGADMELVSCADRRVWAVVKGWEDWRFDTDERLWPLMRRAGEHLFAERVADGVYLVDDPKRSPASLDYLARRFLSEAERRERDALAESRRVEWLYGRIAAKDAVRGLLFERGLRPLFPVEVSVRTTESGAPAVIAPWDGALSVSIAHKGTRALAAVREGEPVGVDIEHIEKRDSSFERVAYRTEELGLLHPQWDREEWLTRLWCAKECVAKARGTGMTNPRALPVTAIDGEALQVDRGAWVQTRRRDDVIVGWTCREREAPRTEEER